MKAIVIDAGPLISFFHKKDPEHQESVKRMKELQEQKIAIYPYRFYLKFINGYFIMLIII